MAPAHRDRSRSWGGRHENPRSGIGSSREDWSGRQHTRSRTYVCIDRIFMKIREERRMIRICRAIRPTLAGGARCDLLGSLMTARRDNPRSLPRIYIYISLDWYASVGTDPSNRFARDLENFYPLSARDATFDRARENSSWNVNLGKTLPFIFPSCNNLFLALLFRVWSWKWWKNSVYNCCFKK